MLRKLQSATAAVLVVAVAALPVILDRCAVTCEAHQDVEATPACHHGSVEGTHIVPAPGACGHDHGETVVTAAKAVRAARQTDAWVIGDVPVRPLAEAPHATRPVHIGPSPPGSLPLAVVSAPLRI
jgi:hypothetical protein